MDWFERLTGFREMTGAAGYAATRQRLQFDGTHLQVLPARRRMAVGRLEMVSLAEWRAGAAAGPPVQGQPTFQVLVGNAGSLHAAPQHQGALFQVASQFNLLEMVGPDVTPEDGVGRYENDFTQGPACAMAAGAATLYRNYGVPVAGVPGQRHGAQLDGFADLGGAIAQALRRPPDTLWTMQNGYALFTQAGIDRMSRHVDTLDDAARDALRSQLRIGVQWDVEVTDCKQQPGPLVSQAFCSALPVSYHRFDAAVHWAPLATLVLEAAYEATLLAAVLNAQRGASRQVLLTLLGGGAFGNDPAWIRAAVQRAWRAVVGHGLDVRLVSFGQPAPGLQAWADALNSPTSGFHG